VASTHVVESTPEAVRSGYALASMAVSFRVTQYAKSVFPDDLRARIAAWLRPGS
jgi:hypothetical protein